MWKYAAFFVLPVLSLRAEPLNILVLYADDWRHDTLGVAGNPVVLTPRLDRLAGEGTRFTNSYVTTSICGVSRASLFTGQWMARHGNRSFGPFDTPWEKTWPGVLRDHGYWAGHVGKWHNGKFPAEMFDFGRSYFGTHWIKGEDGKREHVTHRNQEDALEFLRERPTDKPFFLTVAFFATHAEDGNPLQFLPQPENEKLYKDVEIPIPTTASAEAFARLPEFVGNEKNEGRVRWHWRFDTPEKYQEMMKNYYRLATGVDTACGKILDELEARGLADNTLVIFTTDNGYYHGEHGLADKWYPHEESIRVPLIIRDPRIKKQPATADEVVLNVDLGPTILKAAGFEVPEPMQGRDLGPLFSGKEPKEAWRTEFFYEHPTIRDITFIPASQALIRTDWAYFYWPDFEREQLFDLKKDPGQENDLVGHSASEEKLAEMRKAFQERRKKAGAEQAGEK